jgi:ABC-type glycerol-3-phosphate transport system permease component
MSAKIALNAEDLDRRKRIRKLFSVLRFLLIFIFLAIFLFPVYWIAIGAFKSEGEFYHYPPLLVEPKRLYQVSL